jgi:hypothetical protein
MSVISYRYLVWAAPVTHASSFYVCRPFHCSISPTSYGESVCWLSLSNRYLSFEICLVNFTAISLLEVIGVSFGFHYTIVTWGYRHVSWISLYHLYFRLYSCLMKFTATSLIEGRDWNNAFHYTTVTFKLRIVSHVSLYHRHLRLESDSWISPFHLYFRLGTSCLLACTVAALP